MHTSKKPLSEGHQPNNQQSKKLPFVLQRKGKNNFQFNDAGQIIGSATKAKGVSSPLQVKNKDKRIHMYLASMNNKKQSHNYTFEAQALNLQQKYIEKYGDSGVQKINRVHSGLEIVVAINTQEENTIATLDIFSHGGYSGLWFYHDMEDGPPDVTDYNTLGYEWQFDNEYNGLYMSEEEYESEEGITPDTPQMTKAATLEEIKYANFTNDARIELHGCDTGGTGKDSFGAKLSEKLHSNGKTDAVVISHIGACSDAKDNDPRRGSRVVFWNGDIILSTFISGEIKQDDITKALKKFKTDGTVTQL